MATYTEPLGSAAEFTWERLNNYTEPLGSAADFSWVDGNPLPGNALVICHSQSSLKISSAIATYTSPVILRTEQTKDLFVTNRKLGERYFFPAVPPIQLLCPPPYVHLDGPITYPSDYATFPFVMNGRVGQVYWGNLHDSALPPELRNQSPRDPDGWRWYGPGREVLRLAVKAGTNVLTVSVKFDLDTPPRPTLRLQGSSALGFAEQVVEAPAGTGTFHDLTLSFSSLASGVAAIQIEWWLIQRGATCVWKSFTITN